MRGFEPPASGPPDQHSNRAELHPEKKECEDKNSSTLIILVVDTGFEPVTSAMSMQRSRPTELIDL